MAKRLVAVLVFTVGVTGCSPAPSAHVDRGDAAHVRLSRVALAAPTVGRDTVPSAAPACAFFVQFRGHGYVGSGRELPPSRVGGFLGAGIVPPCNDTGGPPEPDGYTTVYAVAGRSSRVAIAVGSPPVLYAAIPDDDHNDIPLSVN